MLVCAFNEIFKLFDNHEGQGTGTGNRVVDAEFLFGGSC